MKGIEPAQPQQEKPSYAEALEQPLLVVRGDDKPAQHEKEIDEKPGVAQERHAVEVAVGVQMEQRHQACGDAAPAVQHHESSHGHRSPTSALSAHHKTKSATRRAPSSVKCRSSKKNLGKG